MGRIQFMLSYIGEVIIAPPGAFCRTRASIGGGGLDRPARDGTLSGERMVRGDAIWIVNADHWPRAYLRAELIERGYDAIGFETLKDALVRLGPGPGAPPALLILDLHGQIPSDGERRALSQRGVPILAVLDAAQSDDQSPAPLAGTLHRPLTIGAIADAVAGAVERGGR